MSPAEVLAVIRAHGGDVVLVNGKPRLRAPAPLPVDVVALARQHKPELIRSLSAAPSSKPSADTATSLVPPPFTVMPPHMREPAWRCEIRRWSPAFQEAWRDLSGAYVKVSGHHPSAAEYLAYLTFADDPMRFTWEPKEH